MTSARVRAVLVPTAFTIGFIALLEVLRRLSGASDAVFPPMVDVAHELVGLPFESGVTGDYAFWTMLVATLKAWLGALLLAMVIGIPIGFAMGANKWMRSTFTVVVEFLRPIPSVALIPLAVVMFGAGFESKVFLATFAAVWPLLYQARYAAASIDPVLRQTAAVYGLSRVGRVLYVIGPSISPFLATGIRLAASISLILVITSELLIGGGGLGGGIEFARLGADLPRFYALMIVTGVIGYLMSLLLATLEARVLFWHPSHREVVE